MFPMNKIKLPKPGLRNIKTALSVFFCMLLFEFMGRPNPLFACSATIICMKETVYYSYQKGVDRIVGTLLGGIVGFVFLLIKNYLLLLHIEAITAGLGIFIVIYLCNLFNKSGASIISSVVVLTIVVGTGKDSPFLYALNRTFDTFIGIIIALLVNKYIYPVREGDKPPNEG